MNMKDLDLCLALVCAHLAEYLQFHLERLR
jgi:hypothetical protein